MNAGTGLYIIAPDLRSGGRRLPCSVLGDWMVQGRPRRFTTPAQQRALLLAAVNLHLFAALALDLGIDPDNIAQNAGLPPDPAAGWPHCSGFASCTVPVRELALPRGSGLTLLVQTYLLLERLPVSWAESIVAWAPPVVAELKPRRWGVCANPASGLIAQARLLDSNIPVRIVDHERAFPPIKDLKQIRVLVGVALPRLMGVCHGLKQQIADFSDGILSGQWENQLRRAMTYRHRQRARVEREMALREVQALDPSEAPSGSEGFPEATAVTGFPVTPDVALSLEATPDASADE